MKLRHIRPLAAATAITLMAGLAGCTPTPEPTPTPTALFSSEEEAFKAAEKVYRAYVEESNAERDGDADADPNRWLSGLALESAIEGERTFEKIKAKVEGRTTVASVTSASSNLTATPPSVELNVCLDVSQARIIGESGEDLTSSTRPLRAATIVTVHFSTDGPTITDTIIPSENPC